MKEPNMFSFWNNEVKEYLNKTGLTISYRKRDTGDTLVEKHRMPSIMCYTNDTGRLTVAFDGGEARGFFTPVNGAKSTVRYKEAFKDDFPDPQNGAVFVINKNNEFIRTSYILDTPFETIVSGYKEKAHTLALTNEKIDHLVERE